MLEEAKRTDDYAKNIVRLLLIDLKNASHQVKVKNIKKFADYLNDYRPEIGAETVDSLFTGQGFTQLSGQGLIYWSGVDSENHAGQLKRICGPVIGLIRRLITFDSTEDGNMFYERFVRIPMEELVKINFPKHILGSGEGKGLTLPSLGRKGRAGAAAEGKRGSMSEAFEILAVLIGDHRSQDTGEPEPIDIDYLLKGSKTCAERFQTWRENEESEFITQTLTAYKEAKMNAMKIGERPVSWAELHFKPVPQQEDEDGIVEIEDEEDVIAPIRDPLGLAGSEVDLRHVQSWYTAGKLGMTSSGALTRRSSIVNAGGSSSAPSGAPGRGRTRDTIEMLYYDEDDEEEEDGDDEEEDEEEVGGEDQAVVVRQNNRVSVREGMQPALLKKNAARSNLPSILPHEKNFSTSLFLSIIHGGVSFRQLQQGMENLKELLKQQSSRRENLVRLHYGLFVQCAEGLEWMKAYRKGNVTMKRRSSFVRGTVEDKYVKNNRNAIRGEERLKNAQASLDMAKREAKSTLAPILERTKQSRKIRSAEKVLRRMAAILEHPYRMRLALEKNDLSEVIVIYKRILAMLPSSSSSSQMSSPNNAIIAGGSVHHSGNNTSGAGNASGGSVGGGGVGVGIGGVGGERHGSVASPMRILQRVKDSADEVIAKLRKQCYQTLHSPNANYAKLLRYARILLDLDGEAAYVSALRQSFLCQAIQFVRGVKDVRDAFMSESVDRFNKGVELNVLRKTSTLAASAVFVNDGSGGGGGVKSPPMDLSISGRHTPARRGSRTSAEGGEGAERDAGHGQGTWAGAGTGSARKDLMHSASSLMSPTPTTGGGGTGSSGQLSSSKIIRKKSFRRTASIRLINHAKGGGGAGGGGIGELGGDFGSAHAESLFEVEAEQQMHFAQQYQNALHIDNDNIDDDEINDTRGRGASYSSAYSTGANGKRGSVVAGGALGGNSGHERVGSLAEIDFSTKTAFEEADFDLEDDEVSEYDLDAEAEYLLEMQDDASTLQQPRGSAGAGGGAGGGAAAIPPPFSVHDSVANNRGRTDFRQPVPSFSSPDAMQGIHTAAVRQGAAGAVDGGTGGARNQTFGFLAAQLAASNASAPGGGSHVGARGKTPTGSAYGHQPHGTVNPAWYSAAAANGAVNGVHLSEVALSRGVGYDGFDYTPRIAASIRLNYVEKFVDLVAKWFPCLFRLVTELNMHSPRSGVGVGGGFFDVPRHTDSHIHQDSASTFQLNMRGGGTGGVSVGGGGGGGGSGLGIGSGGGSGIADNNRLKVRSLSRAETNLLSRGGMLGAEIDGAGVGGGVLNAVSRQMLGQAVSPAKVLGATLGLCADYLRQIIDGSGCKTVSFMLFSLPAELKVAFVEESDAASALFTAMRADREREAAGRVLHPLFSSDLYSQQLEEPRRRFALQMVFDLYDAIESVMQAAAAAAAASEKESPAAAAAAADSGWASLKADDSGGARENIPFANKYMSFGAEAERKRSLIESGKTLYSPSSPYFESMTTLRDMAKEGEVSYAHKIVDRLVELSFHLGDVNSTSSNTVAHRTKSASIHSSVAGMGAVGLRASVAVADYSSSLPAAPASSSAPSPAVRSRSAALQQQQQQYAASNSQNWLASSSRDDFGLLLRQQRRGMDNYPAASGVSSGAGNLATSVSRHGSGVCGPSMFGGMGGDFSAAGLTTQDALEGGALGVGRRITRVENMVKNLESLICSCIRRLAEKSRRHDWSSGIVREGVARVMKTFSEALRREAILIDDSSSVLFRHKSTTNKPHRKKRSTASSSLAHGVSKGRRASSVMNNAFVLQSMEDDLKHGDANNALKIEMFLDLVRATVRLRTRTIRVIWTAVDREFPIPAPEATIPLGLGFGTIGLPVDDFEGGGVGGGGGDVAHGSDRKGSVQSQTSALGKLFTYDDSPEPASSSGGAAGGNSRNGFISSDLTKSLSERLWDLAGRIKSEEIARNVKDNLGVEVNAVKSYVQLKLKTIRNMIQSGFSLIVHKEALLAGLPPPESPSSFRHPYTHGYDSGLSSADGNGLGMHGMQEEVTFPVPTHVSRILLMIGQEREVLIAQLGSLTIERGMKAAARRGRMGAKRSPQHQRWRPGGGVRGGGASIGPSRRRSRRGTTGEEEGESSERGSVRGSLRGSVLDNSRRPSNASTSFDIGRARSRSGMKLGSSNGGGGARNRVTSFAFGDGGATAEEDFEFGGEGYGAAYGDGFADPEMEGFDGELLDDGDGLMEVDALEDSEEGVMSYLTPRGYGDGYGDGDAAGGESAGRSARRREEGVSVLQLYSDHILREICNGVLDLYGDLIVMLSKNTLMQALGGVPSTSDSSTAAVSSDVPPVRGSLVRSNADIHTANKNFALSSSSSSSSSDVHGRGNNHDNFRALPVPPPSTGAAPPVRSSMAARPLPGVPESMGLWKAAPLAHFTDAQKRGGSVKFNSTVEVESFDYSDITDPRLHRVSAGPGGGRGDSSTYPTACAGSTAGSNGKRGSSYTHSNTEGGKKKSVMISTSLGMREVSTAGSTTPLALGQAIEEYEFLRDIMEGMIPPSSDHRHAPDPTRADVGAKGNLLRSVVAGAGYRFISIDQLKTEARLFALMISNVQKQQLGGDRRAQ